MRTTKGAAQPAHLLSLIIRCLDGIIPFLSKSKIARLKLVSVAYQTCLSLTWSQTPITPSDVLHGG